MFGVTAETLNISVSIKQNKYLYNNPRKIKLHGTTWHNFRNYINNYILGFRKLQRTNS